MSLPRITPINPALIVEAFDYPDFLFKLVGFRSI
jgi:hypothetical protein